MVSLKNSLILFALSILVGSCTHSVFKIDKSDEVLHEVIVSSDRIETYCEKVVTDQPNDGPGFYTFYPLAVIVRDELNLLNWLYIPWKYSEKECKKREAIFAKILAKNKIVRMGIYSSFKNRIPEKESKVIYPVLEKFGKKYKHSEMAASLRSIWTDSGDCWDMFVDAGGSDGEKTCPSKSSMFPLK